jgi:hypothetical protein
VAKNTLAQQDVQYGRRCNSIQAHFVDGLTRLCQIELALRNLDPNPDQFQVMMSRPSSLEEQQRVDVTLNLIEAAKGMIEFGTTASLDMVAWTRHVLKATLGMTTFEIAKYTRGLEDRVAAHPEVGLGDFKPAPAGGGATGYNALGHDDTPDDQAEPPAGQREIPTDTGEPIKQEDYGAIPINEIERRVRGFLSRPRSNGGGDVRLYEHPGDHPAHGDPKLPADPSE